MIKAEAKSLNALDPELLELWQAWQTQQAAFNSPLFSPFLANAAARVREHAEVAVLSDSDGPLGFFPYLRQGNTAAPLLGCLASLQSIVARPKAALTTNPTNASQIARDCGLRAIELNCVPIEQPIFRSHLVAFDDYPYIDLSQGFDAYRSERKAAKRDELTTALRKTRKIQREIGELHFEAESRCHESLNTLLQWKAKQLSHLKVVNHLQQTWVGELFDYLLSERHADEPTRGVLSTLHVKGVLLAASIGIRSETVLHGWVTAFNRDFYKYSPGSLLVAQLAQSAEEMGIQRIDLGRGPETYKQSFRSGGIAVGQGAVETRTFLRAAKLAYLHSRDWIKASPIGGLAQRVVNNAKWALHAKRSASET